MAVTTPSPKVNRSVLELKKTCGLASPKMIMNAAHRKRALYLPSVTLSGWRGASAVVAAGSSTATGGGLVTDMSAPRLASSGTPGIVDWSCGYHGDLGMVYCVCAQVDAAPKLATHPPPI